jgi:DNA polymerase-3 subunit epsilon
MYTIIDVETMGQGNKITEISIFKHDGTQVVKEFTTLVNPEAYIPEYITALTGINNKMVVNAPKFSQIANTILTITDNTVFVAHNVNFDYNVIRHEFKAIGIDFRRKKLCTVRLSRQLIPGHKSYSLGKLCNALDIEINGRHRARGDAEATVTLFEKLLNIEDSKKVFNQFLNKSSKEATLPPHLPSAVFNNIPNEVGIYYFKNKKGKVIYVGKAKDLKKRVLGHFYNKTDKELNLCRETADIDFELSGNELIALLMEDAAIKQHFPEYNQASKRNTKIYGIFSFEDRNGLIHLAYNVVKASPKPLFTFYSISECRSFLERLCTQFELCPKYCHLQEGVTQCSHYFIKSCRGICTENEPTTLYNERVLKAIMQTRGKSENIVIKEKGRHPNEDAFVLIKNNCYLGYGFIDRNEQITTEDDLENYLIPQKDNVDVQKILRSKLQKL